MRISVVIATYNRASLLEAALRRLRDQHYSPGDEVVVVDNGSTDTTADVIARAAERFPVRLLHLYEPTPGKTAALIAGLAAATGDIVALTDDDVMVSDNWIATIRRLFAESALALVGGRIDPIWERSAPGWLRVEDADGRYSTMCAPLALLHYGQAQDLGRRTAVGANMVVRRSVIDALGGFPPHLGRHRGTLLCGEDHDLSQRAVAAGYRCEYRPELLVRHRVPADRTRLRYFLRWFFWSGVTHALLEASEARQPGSVRRTPLRYFFRQLLIAPLAALMLALAGRAPEAVAHAMDAAFAAGFIAQRIKDRCSSGRAGQLKQRERLSGVHG